MDLPPNDRPPPEPRFFAYPASAPMVARVIPAMSVAMSFVVEEVMSGPAEYLFGEAAFGRSRQHWYPKRGSPTDVTKKHSDSGDDVGSSAETATCNGRRAGIGRIRVLGANLLFWPTTPVPPDLLTRGAPRIVDSKRPLTDLKGLVP